jgi:RNA polymerase sigma factor (sigma-70 family)
MDALPVTWVATALNVVDSMSNPHSGNRIAEKSDSSLLRQLKSSEAWAAWAELLKRHGSLIMRTASQFDFEQERKNECFLFVSEKLSDDGFKRLLKYKRGRNTSFRTWLITVSFNLCVDWHRKEYGRAMLLPAISALPSFDQLVFRYSFEQGMAGQECLQALATEFPDVTRQQLSRAIRRVHAVLTPRQRWQIGVRHRRMRSPGGPDHELRSLDVDCLPSPDQDPVISAQKQQELDGLNKALAKLTVRQRVLLHLRFNDGLTLKQIAKIVHLGDSARVWRHINAALRALSDQIQANDDLNPRKK